MTTPATLPGAGALFPEQTSVRPMWWSIAMEQANPELLLPLGLLSTVQERFPHGA